MEVTMKRAMIAAIASITLLSSATAWSQEASAVAGLSGSPAATAQSTSNVLGSVMVPPSPHTATKLFNPINEAQDQACPRKEEVIAHYIVSDSDLKAGTVKLLAGELPQLFSDRWRLSLHMPTITV